ncbi:alpha/beta fold hydrolase [Winogradskyella ursingii]|uniref:alpha/beta fold hydrolase n=1 Tax=Winogradskyella ursingii TaxID=2686079 RepID=UPI001FE7E1A9|nr:alpha/beta fold hydrolase [Winogradskyella ursingii]
MSDLKYIDIPNFNIENNKTIDIKLSYQTFGKPLYEAPIVLVNHALTGNSNVCGNNGWWSDLIGMNKCIDTNNYTVLAFNVPGNKYDVLEENNIENYKDFTARTIAEIFSEGLKALEIDKLFAVIGGSVGGGIAWELSALRPKLIENLIPVATDWKSTDWVIANCHIQDSILNNSKNPLFDARLHAMTLYRTPESFTFKFNRTEKEKGFYNVESWLSHHGNFMNKRFQLSAYKLMNQILRTIDITQGNETNFLKVASKIESNIHLITIKSDLLFKTEEHWDTYVQLKSVKQNVTMGEIKSIHGHDAFLIEYKQLIKLLRPIFDIKKTKNENNQFSHIRDW